MEKTNYELTSKFGFRLISNWEALGFCLDVVKVNQGVAVMVQINEEEYITVGMHQSIFKIDEFINWYNNQDSNPVVYFKGEMVDGALLATSIEVSKQEQISKHYA